MSDFVVGELVRVDMAFVNGAGAAADPTGVLFEYKDSEGTVTELVYGVDAALVKDSTGNYHVDINVTQHGTWKWYSNATGTGQAAAKGSFEVEAKYAA